MKTAKKILFNTAKETSPRLSSEIVRNKIGIIVYARASIRLSITIVSRVNRIIEGKLAKNRHNCDNYIRDCARNILVSH